MGPKGGERPLEALREGRWGAFCGIGNPEGFRLALERLGARLAAFSPFPDHHRYRARELADVLRAAAQARAEGVVTTQKDAVKLAHALPAEPAVPVFALAVRFELTEGATAFERLVTTFYGTGTGDDSLFAYQPMDFSVELPFSEVARGMVRNFVIYPLLGLVVLALLIVILVRWRKRRKGMPSTS